MDVVGLQGYSLFDKFCDKVCWSQWVPKFEGSVMSIENGLSMFIENLTLAILLACMWSTLCRSWWRYCASRRKVPISIPKRVIGIFH
jgi:hypothetical protein